MVVSLWVRSLPAFLMDLPHYSTFSSPDIWFNFRQIESMIHNYPVYNWFDPMTAYPTGKLVDWGPFLPFSIATLSILTGMTSRADMMHLASFLIPILAAIMVPVTFFIGKILWDWKTGIIASGLLAVTSGIYFVTTSFGYVDHHAFEALLGAIFCLLYLVTLKFCKNHSAGFYRKRTLFVFIGLSLLTALAYFAGYLNMPTMIIFGLIVIIYTFIQVILDTLTDKPDNSLLFTNLGIFSLVAFFMLIFGVQQGGFSLQQYSAGHILVMISIIVETVVLYALSRYLNANKVVFSLAIIAVVTAGLLSVFLFSKETFYQLITLFGQTEDISTITESQPWSFDLAVSTYNIMLIFIILGFVILSYQMYTKKRGEHLFFMIWSLIMLALTIQHLRFEYYLAVNAVLLSSLCIVTGLKAGFARLGNSFTIVPPSESAVMADRDGKNLPGKQVKKAGKLPKKTKYSIKTKKPDHNLVLGVIIIAVVVAATAISIGLSVENDIGYSTSPYLLISGSWVETTGWLGTNTPDPGVDYFGTYQKDLFSYPATSYGILSWWDYGHYITFIGKRIPVTNPFQDHLLGPEGAAAFYMSGSETNATGILQVMGARYVITDTSLATDKFESLATWYDSKTDIFSYMKSFFVQNPAKSGQLLQFNGELPPYFHKTVVRLHNYDGSMQVPEKVAYLEYYNENRNGFIYPMVTSAKFMNVTDATNAIHAFEQQPRENSRAILVGQFLQPIERVPALQHFRLVHESPGNSSIIIVYDNSGAEHLNLVKVFEFVKGAHIRGEGTIELQVVTNTGRTFMYRQESDNGEFIVPYSTINNPYDVTANGKYHILGTSIGIDVTEKDILEGNEVKY